MTKSPVDFARENPTMFLAGGVVDLRDFAGALITDALVLDAHPVVAEITQDGWYIVAAEEDWIKKECRYSVFDSFYRLQIFHKHQQNSNRANLMITAFTKRVVTFGVDGKTIVKGGDLDLYELERLVFNKYEGYRVVAFCGIDPPDVGLGKPT